MRSRTLAGLVALLCTGIITASPVQAQDDGQAPDTTLRELPGAVTIGNGFSFTGAVITPPAGEDPRTLDAYQAAVFVQSWLPTSIFGKDVRKDPPPDLPVYQIDIMGNWAGPVGTITVYFATDGTTPYVAFPQDQPVATEPGGPPPLPADWFVPPARVIDAFNGDAELVDTAGTQTTTTTPESGGAPSDDSSTSSGWTWAAIAAAGVVLVGLVLRWRSS